MKKEILPETRSFIDTIWTHDSFMAEYSRTVIDGFSSIRKIYRSADRDITSTEIVTEIVKAREPSVFITSETFLEENDGKLEPGDFEYRQSFRVGKPAGNTRSVYHGTDVIARIFYVSQRVYLFKPLDIFFGDHEINYMIVIANDDGSYSFFTDSNDIVAVAGREDGDFPVLVRYDLKELAAFVSSIEELVFEPDNGQAISEFSEDEENFKSLNQQIKRAKEIMMGCLGNSDDLSLLYSPAINLVSFIKRECPDAICSYKSLDNRQLLDEISFVQEVKDRCYGIDGCEPRRGSTGTNQTKQMEISDYL